MPATTSSLAVSAHGLSKSFGDTAAVSEVDLEISSGTVFGLLGPDGAGKSTLIRMLATVLTPDAGSASVFGKSVTDQSDAVTGRIGYMSQRFSMYPDLSVAENLEFFATVRGVSRRDRTDRSQRLLASMGLAEFADRQAENLSGGMKQKLMLATTLMHDPDLLLLDEPTTGVDPVSRREFWRILAGLHREGRTVLVATPYMDEAERCTDIAFLDNGRITRAGTPEQIKAQVPGRLVEVTSAQPRRALAIIEPLAGVGSAHLLGDVVRVLWSAPSDPSTELGAALRAGGLAEAKVSPADIDMETVFAFLAETATTDHEPVRS